MNACTIRVFSCELCENYFSEQNEIKAHKKDVHQFYVDKDYIINNLRASIKNKSDKNEVLNTPSNTKVRKLTNMSLS